MPKLLIVARGRPELIPSTRYRVGVFLPHLSAASVSFRIVFPPERRKRQFYLWPAFYLLLLFWGLQSEAILIQKDIFCLWIWRFFKALNTRLIFDFDDAIYLDGPGKRRNVYLALPTRSETREIVGRMIAMADRVLVANSELLKFAMEFNTESTIIPMPVESEAWTKTGSLKRGVTIGWIGSPNTVGYLAPLEPVLSHLVAEYPQIQIKIVTNGKVPFRGFPFQHCPWTKETEAAEFASIDIGIVPLPAEDPFARAKSSYKLLQFMAAGIPTIATAVGFNCDLINNSTNGFLAHNSSDWMGSLQLLIDHPELRDRVGKAARETIRSRFSLESVAPRWLEALGFDGNKKTDQCTTTSLSE